MKVLDEKSTIIIRDEGEESLILKHLSKNQPDLRWVNGLGRLTTFIPSRNLKDFPYTIGIFSEMLCITVKGNRKEYTVPEFVQSKTQTFCEWLNN